MRQIDIELFAAAAVTDNPRAQWARAVGAAVAVKMGFGGALPLSLYYQFAYRFDFGLLPLHLVGIAFE